ncbi:hypothetical protein GCM10023200_56810 [Actinomycetospora chlora]|uniref:Zinc ribbon domain-containing protein n=1 Tax=Actinomycetospora chlora TaxID=663608 RepID=A0ABP9CN59_9PSEU
MTTIDAPGVRCPGCTALLRPGTRFCVHCGAPVPVAPPPRPPSQQDTWVPRPAPFPPPLPPPPPPPSWRGPARWLAVGLAVLVTVAAVVGAAIVLREDAPSPSAGPAPVASPAPGPVLPADPAAALQERSRTDAGAVEQLVGAWIPQLSAKRAGMVVDGTTYDAAAVLADHQRLRAAYPDALLVWSGSFTSFRGGDFWVTVVGRSFPSAAAANAWCDSAGLGADDCYAKRLSRTDGAAGNTVQRSGTGSSAGTPATGAEPVLGDPGWAPGVIGFGVARPSEINANGDGTSHADGVTWTSWGGPRAQGRATAFWVPPGGFQYQGVARPAVVVAWDLGDCHGRLAYRQVSWYFPTEGETAPTDGYHICDGS